MGRTLRALIVDDEPLAVERMQVVCARLGELEVAGTASDGDAAMRLIEVLEPDVVLLDISMPVADGMTVASRLARWDNPPAIVFVTAHDSFAVEAFDLEAVDYVLKPVSPERLARAIARVSALRATGGRRGTPQWLSELWVPNRDALLRLATAEIDRIDAERDYVRLHVAQRSYLLLHTIAGLQERLDPAQFIRVHRSHIVRRDFITELHHEGMGKWCARLRDGALLRIGRTYLPEVKKAAGR